MKNSYSPSSKSNRSYLLRTNIPIDLKETFGGKTRFHISLKDVRNKERHLVSIFLKSLTTQLFNEIRMGKTLSLDDIKEILKVESPSSTVIMFIWEPTHSILKNEKKV